MCEEYLVFFKDWNRKNDLIYCLRRCGLSYKVYEESKCLCIKMTSCCAECLSRLPYICSVVKNISVKMDLDVPFQEVSEIPSKRSGANLPQRYLNYGIRMIKAPSMWERGFTGQGINVAVLDTGIYPHKYLNIAGNVSFVQGESPIDQNGHGTKVAGIIGARGFKEGVVGVAYDCNLYNVKIVSNNGRSMTKNLIEGIDWCIKNRMNVINMSVSLDLPNPVVADELRCIIKNATDRGIIMVSATGNQERNTINPPASVKPVIAIGSVNAKDVKSPTSNYGNGINYVAPGVEIYTTYLNDEYRNFTGTSAATPHASGLIALLLSQNPSFNQKQIEDILSQNAVHLGSPGYNIEYGYGRIQAPLMR